MEYEYTINEDYPEGATKFNSSWSTDSVKYIAEDAAAHFFYEALEPEMFPIEVEIYDQGEHCGKFEVSLEFHPEFSAVSIK